MSFNVSNVPGAEAIKSPMTVLTYDVVATFVLLLDDSTVGAVTVPVNVGLANGAFKSNCVLT